jgi:PAS domain S-box-containing protein
LEKLVQSCSAAIIGTTLEGTIISWNAGAERLYGYSAAESAGKPLSALYSPHRPEELADHLERVREGKAISCHETVHCRQNGHQVEVAVSLSPIKDGGGAVIGASLVAQDISQRKQEEKERLDLIQELTSALSRTAGPWLEKTGRC